MPKLSHRAFFALLCILAVALGCNVSSKNCTDEAVSGLSLTVVDSATGKDLCDAVVTATDGAYQETLKVFPSPVDGGPPATCSYYGAIERAGTYHIVVARAGTKGAVLDVTVNKGDCHVIPEARTVALEAQ